MKTFDLPIGAIMAYAASATSLPDRWLLCDGKPIPAADYQELITLLGSPNTPNLAGRTVIGTGAPSTGTQSDGTNPNFPAPVDWKLNYTGGEYAHQLTVSEMPSHNHSLVYEFGLYSGCRAGHGSTPCKSTDVQLTHKTGGDGIHNTMQPYYAMNYIIYGGRQ